MKDKSTKICLIIYGVMVIASVILVIIASKNYKSDSLVEKYCEDIVEFGEDWIDKEGNPVDLDNLQLVQGSTEGHYVSIYKQLPETLEEGQALCFLTRHVHYQVYVDGEFMEEQYSPESKVYNKGYGYQWVFVQLSGDDAGKQVEIRFINPYVEGQVSIKNMFIGRELGVALNVVDSKVYDFITSVLLIFIGALFVIADIPMNMQSKKSHELLYLGLISVSVGIWSLCETQVIQMFTGNGRMTNVVSCLAISLIPMPAVLYAYEIVENIKKFGAYLVCGLSAVSFSLCMILHFAGVSDLRENLILSHVLIVVGFAFIMYAIFVSLKIRDKNKQNVYNLLRGVGVGLFAITAVIDLYRYYNKTGEDSAVFVRIGLLIFVMCYGFASMEKTIRAVQMGARSELLSQLAYKDGLTGIGNRTAYQEYIEELNKLLETRSDEKQVGVIMFDVNNLKQVNDLLGHQYGDRMIVDSAELIKTSFAETPARCYRIGGDEFAVIIHETDAENLIKKGLDAFIKSIEKYNKDEDSFKITIARGYSVFKADEKKLSLDEVCQQADKLMYENKRIVKNQESKEKNLSN